MRPVCLLRQLLPSPEAQSGFCQPLHLLAEVATYGWGQTYLPEFRTLPAFAPLSSHRVKNELSALLACQHFSGCGQPHHG